MIFLTIIVFVLIFSLLILIHELGHFTAAKKSGVKVEEFGIGLPPRIWGVKRGETLYSFNWIPFGGFVRMLGENAADKASKSKRSFSNQSLRKQAVIVCAGVFMNLLLAFVLLTVGFVVGIEPLIASEGEFFDAVEEGIVVIEPVMEIAAADVDAAEGADELEAQLLYLPRLFYLENENSVFAGQLDGGDFIVTVNGREVLLEDDLYEAFGYGMHGSDIVAFRPSDGTQVNAHIELGSETTTIISYIEPGSPADEAGLLEGDVVKLVGDQPVYAADNVSLYTDEHAIGGLINYEIVREDAEGEEAWITLTIPLREDGRVGIGVSDLLPAYDNFSLYQSYATHELVETKELSYGLSAPIVAAKEMWRLGKLTAVMFVGVLGDFITGGDVPDGVAGPVGIAQMTFVNMQSGFSAMLRFVAMLSLSLGVINILPLPALDGGRLAFILYQALTGRKPNPHLEYWIHTVGFFLLILFIFYITFNDVLNLI